MAYPNLTTDDLCEATFGRCFYCGRLISRRHCETPSKDWLIIGYQQKPVTEHSIPKYRGGTDCPSNLVPSCQRCNIRKGRLTIGEFRLRLGLEKRNPSFTFPREMPEPYRDWLCVYSKARERGLLHSNFPRLAASYR